MPRYRDSMIWHDLDCAHMKERSHECTCGAEGHNDPIHKEGESWYFYDETWSERHGPFASRLEAQTQLGNYVNYLENGLKDHDYRCRLHDPDSGLGCDCKVSVRHVGSWYRFDYPEEFVTLTEYSAHRGQPVIVRGLASHDDVDPECTPNYLVRAQDGWEGQANYAELTGPACREPEDVKLGEDEEVHDTQSSTDAKQPEDHDDCLGCQAIDGYHEVGCTVHDLKDTPCRVFNGPEDHDDDCARRDPEKFESHFCTCKTDPTEPSRDDLSRDYSWMIVAVDASGEGWIMDAAPGFSEQELLPNGLSCDDNGVLVPALQTGIYRVTDVSVGTTYDYETQEPDGCEIDGEQWTPLWTAFGGVPHRKDCPVAKGSRDLSNCTCSQPPDPDASDWAEAPPGVVKAFEGTGS